MRVSPQLLLLVRLANTTKKDGSTPYECHGFRFNRIKPVRYNMAEANILEPKKMEDDIDGCDCPIEDTDATQDEDLPAADGGVA